MDVYKPGTEQFELAEQILAIYDMQQSEHGMPRGDLQGVVEALANKYQLRR